MKALVARDYGPLEDLVVEEMPVPVPGPGQLLVRTEAAALNPADTALITGAMRDVLPVGHPFIPGVDTAGIVVAVGEGVTRFAVGDPVLAWNGIPSGTLAEFAIVGDGPGTGHRPAALDPVRAAALPTATLTGAALLDAAEVKPGGTLLIVGASGGIGSFLVQMAVQAGVRVLATGRAEDEEYLRGLGAHEFIDYRDAAVAAQTRRLVPGGVDAVIDLALAGPALAGSAAAVRSGGLVVSPKGGPDLFDGGVTGVYTGVTRPEGRLEGFATQAAEGRLQVPIAAEYPFADVRQAVIDFPRRHLLGKAIVVFPPIEAE
ncbi:NADPH2:quinone reductase [Catenulispora sp. MAP5-51]|uniref:NADP-dependent oxidoreductase n=1 Tax=Catenulispora sp. MAP5-51 TaxID=3156298 RepID=UPI003516C93E